MIQVYCFVVMTMWNPLTQETEIDQTCKML
jgi:hypothetical protein